MELLLGSSSLRSRLETQQPGGNTTESTSEDDKDEDSKVDHLL